MTEDQKLDLMKKFKELNVADYTTKYGDYYGLMFAGAEIATKELQEENEKLKRQYEFLSNQICNKECAEVWSENSEAKEIIKEYNDVAEKILIYKKRDTEKITKIKKRAEAFLKECGE